MEKILIFFCPGARGDFLFAVLSGQIYRCYNQYTIQSISKYIKMHGLRDINPYGVNLDEMDLLHYKQTSIKIKMQTTDYAFVSRLTKYKKLPIALPIEYLQGWEQQYQYLDNHFGHIVNFSDLFNVEFLREFYQKFNNRPMPDSMIPLIEHNIQLQINYKP